MTLSIQIEVQGKPDEQEAVSRTNDQINAIGFNSGVNPIEFDEVLANELFDALITIRSIVARARARIR